MPCVVSGMDKVSAIALVLQTTCCFTPQRLHGVKTILERPTLRETEYCYQVVIPWSSQLDTVTAWNEVCAQGMEMFGLPGNRYVTEANINNMIWYFRDPQDALIMTLKFSEVLI